MNGHYTLAVAWDWEYDAAFVSLLEAQTHAHHLRFFSISHHSSHFVGFGAERNLITSLFSKHDASLRIHISCFTRCCIHGRNKKESYDTFNRGVNQIAQGLA